MFKTVWEILENSVSIPTQISHSDLYVCVQLKTETQIAIVINQSSNIIQSKEKWTNEPDTCILRNDHRKVLKSRSVLWEFKYFFYLYFCVGGFAFMYVCAQVCASWLQRPMRVIKPLEMFWTAMCVLGIEPGSLILEPSYQPPRVCFLEVNPCISVRVKFCLCSKDIEMLNTPYACKSHCLVQPPLSSRGLGTSHAVQSVCVLSSEPRMQGCCVIQHQSPLSEASHFEHTFNVTWLLFLCIEKLYTVARVLDALTSSYATPCGVMNHTQFHWQGMQDSREARHVETVSVLRETSGPGNTRTHTLHHDP